MTKLATLDLGTTASAGYQSLFELGPTVHPPARSRRPSLVITQNLHSVHSGIPVTLTDMEVVPPVVLKYLTVAPNGPLVTCDTSKGGLEFSASVAATAPPPAPPRPHPTPPPPTRRALLAPPPPAHRSRVAFDWLLLFFLLDVGS